MPFCAYSCWISSTHDYYLYTTPEDIAKVRSLWEDWNKKKSESNRSVSEHGQKHGEGSKSQKSKLEEREARGMENLANFIEQKGGDRNTIAKYRCQVTLKPSNGRYNVSFFNEHGKRFRSISEVGRFLNLLDDKSGSSARLAADYNKEMSSVQSGDLEVIAPSVTSDSKNMHALSGVKHEEIVDENGEDGNKKNKTNRSISENDRRGGDSNEEEDRPRKRQAIGVKREEITNDGVVDTSKYVPQRRTNDSSNNEEEPPKSRQTISIKREEINGCDGVVNNSEYESQRSQQQPRDSAIKNESAHIGSIIKRETRDSNNGGGHVADCPIKREEASIVPKKEARIKAHDRNESSTNRDFSEIFHSEVPIKMEED